MLSFLSLKLLSLSLSSVHFKASFKPSWVKQRDLLTPLSPSLVFDISSSI